MHILVATDADYVLDDITAALSGPDTSFTVCRDGRDVSKVVQGRTPDLAILDLQVGSMGGMARDRGGVAAFSHTARQGAALVTTAWLFGRGPAAG